MPEVRHVLLWPFLPQDVRLRLRHQRLDDEASKRTAYILATPDIEVRLVKAVDGGGSGPGMRLVPEAPAGWPVSRNASTEWGRWYTYGGMAWNGRRVYLTGARRGSDWLPAPGGLRPGFDAVEVFRAGVRPIGSGECLDRVAAIATVGLAGRHLQRIVWLDEEARELAAMPMRGFVEDDLVRYAEAAGISYRSYALTLAKFSSLRVLPPALCEALFPRSARRVKIVGDELEIVEDWYTRRSLRPGS